MVHSQHKICIPGQTRQAIKKKQENEGGKKEDILYKEHGAKAAHSRLIMGLLGKIIMSAVVKGN